MIAQPKLPRIIAHRGASYARPENTAAAFDLALAEACDGIELDLQLTRDDQVVVFHDKTLSMLGLKHRRIGQYRRGELDEIDAGAWFSPEFAGERVLDLETVLDRYGGQTDLYLEIKPVGELRRPERAQRLARRVAEAVAAHPCHHRVYLLSFSALVLAEVEICGQGLRRVRNLEHPSDLETMSEQELGRLYGVCVDIRHFWPDDVARAHNAARHLLAYTCDEPKHLRMAMQLDVSAVITNRPAASRARLTKMAGLPG